MKRVIDAILRNPKKMQKIYNCNTTADMRQKARNLVIGMARELGVSASEKEINKATVSLCGGVS